MPYELVKLRTCWVSSGFHPLIRFLNNSMSSERYRQEPTTCVRLRCMEYGKVCHKDGLRIITRETETRSGFAAVSAASDLLVPRQRRSAL